MHASSPSDRFPVRDADGEASSCADPEADRRYLPDVRVNGTAALNSVAARTLGRR